ncbi:pyridoxal phosphate-dependent aminotransferase [Limnochorda pilosa]|uniref:Aminotransferase n=1 Tax=Limnochorda pilosa TaxID=1555112 RepID=A0A0K2SNX7_LIMPI|nr:pyridoxal phosphate-dependent aminotransferase [Limnochorda pilosa]BAS28820.1 aspartate aminotransferase [Limnochorda pilosa]
MELARRIDRIEPSPTLAMSARARALTQQGVDVVDLGVGEPDFDTPEPIKEAAVRALRDGRTKYTASAGIPELREAIAQKLRRENGLPYAREDVLVTVGAKHAVYLALQALCNPGDRVLLPAPYWVSYAEQVRLVDAEPVFLPTREEDGFKLTPETLAAHVAGARALILNSPNNPTGAVYTPQELGALGEVLDREPGCWLLSDEIYEPFVYDGARHASLLALRPELRERAVLIHGFSKTYAMTGWRLGYAAGPRPLVAAMVNLQSHSTSNATSFAQVAAVEALQGSQRPVEEMVRVFQQRRDLLLSGLARLPGLRCTRPAGAFYLFPNVSGVFGRSYRGEVVHGSQDLAERLLDGVATATVPGTAFGTEGYLRLSYAASTERLEEGLHRLNAFWEETEP